MADEVDVTSEVSLRELAYQEAAVRLKAAKLEVESTGYCLNCEEPLDKLRWCNADCRDMYEARKKSSFN